MNSLILLCALITDLLLGDPRRLPHPVRWIGQLISFTERLLYPKRRSGRSEFISGCIVCFTVIAVSAGSVWGILRISQMISSVVFFLIQVIIGFYCLSVRSLIDAALEVRKRLNTNDLPGARNMLSMIVGRDTANLDEAGVVCATVETVAENITDGIISPLIYFALGGPVAAIVFKAVSTMDSMIGYKNERYRRFGTCAARLDDLLNFIPARITAFILIPIAAFITGNNWKNAFQIATRDRLKHESPNSAHGEAAMAGALGIRLGGGAFYGGIFSSKPYLGDGEKTADKRDIYGACRITVAVTIIAVAIIAVILSGSSFLFG
jgi:adenosylcobinamide-phosphate synthase